MSTTNASAATYQYTLLHEEALEADELKGQTHKAIASAINDVINTQPRALTIGLEGSWGAGKSTIISILRKQIAAQTGTLFVQIDAWAHEGDPLRRSLLERLIQDLCNQAKKWDIKRKLLKLQRQISGKWKTAKTTTSKGMASLGKWFGICLLLMPFGIAIFPKDEFFGSWRNLLVDSSFQAKIGTFFVFSWAFVLLINAVYRLCKRQFLLASSWKFLQGETTETSEQDISEGSDRTSIEFAQFFDEITEIAFQDLNINRIIIVLDNLDRIDASDALKIWSTLQVFFQQRSLSPDLRKPSLDRVWIIVPYDLNGLRKLWKKENLDDDGTVAKSFFEKCFQLRVHVPKPIFADWTRFAIQLIEKACAAWPETEKEKFVNILGPLRRGLIDSPTPRELKSFINQVCFLSWQRAPEIAVTSIAYFVYQLELMNETTDDILKKLMSGELPETQHSAFLTNEIRIDLASLCYGIEKKSVEKLFLQQTVTDALANGLGQELSGMINIYGDTFWQFFSQKLKEKMDLVYLISAAKAVDTGLLAKYSVRCAPFIKRIDDYQLKDGDHINFTNPVGDFIHLINLSNAPGRYYNFLISELNDNIDDQFNWKERLPELRVLFEKARERIDQRPTTLTRLSINAMLAIVNHEHYATFDFCNSIIPSPGIFSQLQAAIQPGAPLVQGIDKVIEFMHQANIQGDWSPVIQACEQYLGNPGPPPNDNVLLLLSKMARMIDKAKIGAVIQKPAFYQFAGRGHYLGEAAFLWAHLFAQPPALPTNPNTGVAHPGLGGWQRINQFWTAKSPENIQAIAEKILEFKDSSSAWRLLANPQYQLAVGVIEDLAADGTPEFFNPENPLPNLAIWDQNLMASAKRPEVFQHLLRSSNIEKQIIETPQLELMALTRPLSLIIGLTENGALATKIGDELLKLNKDAWLKEFNLPVSHALRLLTGVRKRKPDFYMKSGYFDALIDKAKQGNTMLADPEITPANLISLLDKDFSDQFIKTVTNIYLEKKLEVTPEWFGHYADFLERTKIRQAQKTVEDFLATTLQSKDIVKLNQLHRLFGADRNQGMIASASFGATYKEHFDVFYAGATPDTQNQLVGLAPKFGFTIPQPPIEESPTQ